MVGPSCGSCSRDGYLSLMAECRIGFPCGILRTKNGTLFFVGWDYIPIFVEKGGNMAILNFTSREFRSQQAHVFDLADQGEKIIIRRNKKRAYTLVPIEDDDLTITPALQAKLDAARAEIKAGNCTTIRGIEELNAYLDSL